jgi:hypothetical protein
MTMKPPPVRTSCSRIECTKPGRFFHKRPTARSTGQDPVKGVVQPAAELRADPCYVSGREI